MFIDRLKDEKIRKSFQEKREMYRKFVAGEDLSDHPFVKVIMENADKVVAYSLPLSETKIIPVDTEIEAQSVAVPTEILEYFVRNSSHRFIMNFCGCREVLECKDYPIDLGCIFLGEAAKDLHPELGHLASVEEALEQTKRWRKAGFICNLGYVPYDSILLEVGPADRLMSVCGCCPCCCVTTKIKPGRMPGVEVCVTDRCTGCGVCVDTCVYGGIETEGELALTNANCIACGRCVDVCPEAAIELRVSDLSYVRKTIERISQAVDVT